MLNQVEVVENNTELFIEINLTCFIYLKTALRFLGKFSIKYPNKNNIKIKILRNKLKH